MEYRISQHAEDELIIRDIRRKLSMRCFKSPGQIVHGEGGASVFQSRIKPFGPHRTEMLIRAVVDESRTPCGVVTVYLTSKVEKYWKP
jgi:hypothetical protein